MYELANLVSQNGKVLQTAFESVTMFKVINNPSCTVETLSTVLAALSQRF
jgi:hypothetical protein